MSKQSIQKHQGDSAAKSQESTQQADSWILVAVRSRVDSLSQAALIEEVKAHRAKGRRRIVLDLRTTRFLSLQGIQFCVEMANELAREGGGFALLGCPEKTRRHFDIYGSLKNIRLFRSQSEFKAESGDERNNNPAQELMP